MRIASKKLSQRIINASFAFILAMSTVTASLPFAFSQTASAAPVTDGPFSVESVCVDGQAELKMSLKQEGLLIGKLFYKTPYGNSGEHWLGFGDTDNWSVKTNSVATSSVSVRAEVRGGLFGLALLKEYNVTTEAINCDITAPTAALEVKGGKVVDGTRYVRPGDTLKYTVEANDTQSGLDRASYKVFKLEANGVSQISPVCGSWHNGKFPLGSNIATGSFTMKNCNGGTAPADGLYGLGFRVYDNAGNNHRIPNAVFTVDGTDPVVSDFNAPSLASKTLDVSAEATDTGSGVESVRFYIAEMQNGVCKNNYSAISSAYSQRVTIPVGGKYFATIDTSALASGEYCVLASARDNATNNSTPVFMKVTIDNTATVTGDYFAAKAGGLNVGFHVTNLNNNADKVEVALYDADDNLITTNVGDSAQMLALLNTNPADVSSPFWMPSQGATDGWWTFGNPDWKSVSKPSYAVVTVYYNGSEKAVSGHIPFSSPSDTGETWESLLAMLPADQSNGENNQSRDDNNSQGEGNNEQNQGEGAGDQNQSGQGDEAGQSEESQGSTDDAAEGEDVKGTQTTSEPEVKGVSDSNVWTLAGLAWYWWLLVLAILAFIGGLIAALRRRNQENA